MTEQTSTTMTDKTPEEEMKEIEQIHLDAHEHDDDERCVKSNVMSIGSICQCKWWLCVPLKTHNYIPFPLDNVQNVSLYQLENVKALLHQNFRQIKPDVLMYREVKGARLVDGKNVVYRGYDYVGDELTKPFILGHFLDTNAGDTWLTEEEAWKRWQHKVNRTFTALRDKDTPLTIVNLRREDDNYFKRDYLARSGMRLAQFIKGVRKENFRIIQLIEAAAPDVKKEAEDDFFVQYVVPAEDNLKKPFWQRTDNPIFLQLVQENAI